MFRFFFLFLLLSSISLFSEPWGKDADLVKGFVHEEIRKPCRTPLLGRFAESAIQFHQVIISPADGPRSHFYPSSSQYTKDAMRRYGFFKGFIMGCDRLMRENSEEWIYSNYTLPNHQILKYDPVR